MDDDCPDLDAWTSGNIAALMPKLHPDAPAPESIRNSSHDDAPQESQCCTSSDEQYDSNESQEIGGNLENPQNGFTKGIFSSVPSDGARMKLMKRKFGQWWNSNTYRTFWSLSSTWQIFTVRWPNPAEMV